ncbi:uncharacterized protein RAG0_12476 [Rhynchosporium agropyri]|uniref:Uncharacterized protein n=1 Tax=Rhynchosporium agropyri TaxID=914238 RepID=A0A1E1L8G0_9HELO|nr:uncharacterized protein RAG0_12476 [Rhynchosporium agropyri]
MHLAELSPVRSLADSMSTDDDLGGEQVQKKLLCGNWKSWLTAKIQIKFIAVVACESLSRPNRPLAQLAGISRLLASNLFYELHRIGTRNIDICHPPVISTDVAASFAAVLSVAALSNVA